MQEDVFVLVDHAGQQGIETIAHGNGNDTDVNLQNAIGAHPIL